MLTRRDQAERNTSHVFPNISSSCTTNISTTPVSDRSTNLPRSLRTLGAALIMACGAGCGGAHLVTEANMNDRNEVAAIAQSKVKVTHDRHPKVSKVAIIGVNANRLTTKAASNPFDPSRRYREMGRNINDASKQIACQALDAAFDSLPPTLDAVGFHTMLVTDKLGTDTYRSLSENSGGSLLCAASKARVTMESMFLHSARGKQHMSEFQAVLSRFMHETGVDGVLVAVLSANDMTTGHSFLVLLTKQPDGEINPAWQGELKEGALRFEPVITKPNGDAERVQNIARVYHNSFVLLAAKLASDVHKDSKTRVTKTGEHKD